MRQTPAFATICITLSLLAGCSNQPGGSPTGGESFEPSVMESVQYPIESQAVDAEFLKIADDSCNKAQAKGVVEANSDGRLVVVPRSQAYQDFSAVYVPANGEPGQLVYEVDLAACIPSYLISMQKEANKPNSGDYFHKVVQTDATHFEWTQKNWESKAETTTFEVIDGYITATSASFGSFELEYGPVSETDYAALMAAVQANANN